MFPIYTHEEKNEYPKTGNYFVVAGNGIFLHKDNGVVSSYVKVSGIGFLDDFIQANNINYNLRKLPETFCYKVWQFFKKVVELHHAESCIVLYYSKSEQKFYAVVPPQMVTHSSINYIRPSISHLVDWTQIGTIHSHCDFHAFHSGTDVHDEGSFDGLHITFGHNNRDAISISASLVVSSNRMIIDPLEVMDGLEPTPDEYYKFHSNFSCNDDIDRAIKQVNHQAAFTEQNFVHFGE